MNIKRFFSILLPVLLMVIGICIMAYPYLETKKHQNETAGVIKDFFEFVNEETSNETIEVPVNNEEQSTNSAMEDIFGIISIPSIGLEAPMKEGISKQVLNSFVGVYRTSDIPFGELGGNIGIAAHSGKNKGSCWYCYFDYIGELKIGDDIYITTKDKTTHHYRVTEVKTYQNKKSDYAYRMVEDEARLTLVTCSDGNGKYRTFVTAKKVQ